MTNELQEPAAEFPLCPKCDVPYSMCRYPEEKEGSNGAKFLQWSELFSKEYIRVNDSMRHRRHDD